ncbi:MAG TPA: DNA-3-methyladenine glycosylase [Saprospiraceae bacterium]|nr:DNA-3-methyladenine glycosylase [Saprospiraceae bacterium]HMQ84844.1 DNA-3-methyladenine glycosylase [Saprospiraceae bacterium]
MENRLSDRDFFLREDVVQISKDLLGMHLVTYFDGIRTIGRIVEVEAYRGPDDKACHAYNNRRTPRTEVMYQQGGTAYIYFCYGIHHLFNIVTAPAEKAHAVLIRALEPVENIETMLARRGMERLQPRLTAGPGALSQALGIKTDWSGIDLLHPDSPIWLEKPEQFAHEAIAASPRIGVESAGFAATWPWRFFYQNNRWVTKSPFNKQGVNIF